MSPSTRRLSIMATLKTNTLTGTSTAGSIAVTGEGNSTTTNLQQGLTKCWISYKSTNTVLTRDSFNVASTTDNAVGDFSITYTNGMANVNTLPTGSASLGNGATYLNLLDFLVPTTSAQRTQVIFHNTSSDDGSGTDYDYPYNWIKISGDLA